jgi:hypothetical protein
MSSMTLAQIAVKLITVRTEQAIRSFADIRQGGPAMPFASFQLMLRAPDPCCETIIAVGLSGDKAASIG